MIFPPVEGAEDGIVAIGGDLSSERLLLAYHCGIFPWYSKEEPIIWHSPAERFILMLDNLHISKSMKRVLNSNRFSITFDADFSFVIKQCAAVERKNQDGTWITNEMIDAYLELHNLGYAHSVEVWKDEKIVGGLYGVSLGKVFFAESMFHTESNTSKIALIKLVALLKQKDFHFLDAQVHTTHVESLGAKNIARKKFMELLQQGLKDKTWKGNWTGS
ncbi:MAG TPA: leucyl/phenylalanyl-tRNA--protein transferase [Chitinophagales bacterium]|jgi:leucyl/phenylalanyl-tRNA--protein transferase|nr:leucyl/phenylalanyl-tRNA--protein transferase [Chitinophagales bacterium]HQW79363.1 leucyl/phenylalanyl-tRNA--protein transferase [Chitinophagales bacterium]HRB19131.1 leucyl/phenylalanyl-tRNA--protein transferase [Chitinophagales bacterium]HRB68236.1 leucyl/phenylalanyl-tRNA--protein transferase [Chitinophagales bacterium]